MMVRIRAKQVEQTPEPEERKTELAHEKEERVVKQYKERATNPNKAIRAKCVECMGGVLKLVAECTACTCALHPFRMGTNPFRKKRSDAKNNIE